MGSGLLHDLPFEKNLNLLTQLVLYLLWQTALISLSTASALNIIVGNKKHAFSYCGLDRSPTGYLHAPRPLRLPETIMLLRAHVSFESHAFVCVAFLVRFTFICVHSSRAFNLFVAIHTGLLVYSPELLNHFFQSLE